MVRPEQLAKANGIAKNTAYKLIKELKEAGYIFQVQKREESGKFSTGDYLVFRSLEDAAWYAESLENTGVEPCTKKRDAVKRDTVNCELTNKEVNKETEKQKVSQSTARARETFSANESGNFSERVMAELMVDHLPVHKHRYARLKIEEYQERFPESGSVADCYGYVVQAVTHQINLTGS